jgi:hypothetical protein
MSQTRKISELQEFKIEDGFDEMLVQQHNSHRRVSIAQYLFEDEQKALQEIRRILQSGNKPFIIAYETIRIKKHEKIHSIIGKR